MELKIKYIYSLDDLMKGLGLPAGSIGHFEDLDGNRKTGLIFVVETPYAPSAPKYEGMILHE